MPFHQRTMPNGLQIVAETNPNALCVGLAFWVKTGSRDETADLAGVSHFLEHMVFKGTNRRDSFQVNRDFSRIGADNNAFTSEENTVFHATFLPEFLPEAVDVLADILRPALRTEDFTTEKKVILDEIVRYEVQPAWATVENGRKIYFGDHPLGNSVLGSTESVTRLTRDQMHEYFSKRYLASNITVVAAGNFDWDQFVAMIDRDCSHWPSGSVARSDRREIAGTGGIHLLPRPRDKVAQEYVLMMAPAPGADSPLRYASALLTTALGDYSGSRLFWSLVDPGIAEEAGMGADECDAAGVYYTSFNCDPEQTHQCHELVMNILQDVQKNSITLEELELARTKIISREVRAVESRGVHGPERRRHMAENRR